MMLKTIYFVICLVAAGNAYAKDFIKYQDVAGFSGWVEYSDNLSFDNRIIVLPKVVGPANRHWRKKPWGFYTANPEVIQEQGLRVQENGDVSIGFKIVNSNSGRGVNSCVLP